MYEIVNEYLYRQEVNGCLNDIRSEWELVWDRMWINAGMRVYETDDECLNEGVWDRKWMFVWECIRQDEQVLVQEYMRQDEQMFVWECIKQAVNECKSQSISQSHCMSGQKNGRKSMEPLWDIWCPSIGDWKQFHWERACDPFGRNKIVFMYLCKIYAFQVKKINSEPHPFVLEVCFSTTDFLYKHVGCWKLLEQCS